MTTSFQLDSGFGIVDGGASTQTSREYVLPRFIDRILHASSRRLRFSVESGFKDPDNFTRHIKSFASVEQVRFNSWASCFVVVFKTGQSVDSLQWLSALPRRAREIPFVPEVALIDATASSNEQFAEEEDEKFVPTRIILPVCSLGLAIAAGPLSLPPLAVGVFIIGAAHLSFKRAWEGLKKERKINVDFLDALAVLLHSLEGFLLGPAMMITMIEGGEAVRDATQRIANSSNTDLVSSLQSDVRLLTDDGEKIVSSFDLNPGDRVSFLPGDKIPIDGVIESGEASLDVVKLTGESVPRMSGPGEEILAGFIVLEGHIIVTTSAVGNDTRVGQITKMIESAPVFDTRVGNFAANIANRFVIPTLVLAGVSLMLSAGNIAQAASLLMFDLGTGLRVSVPTAIMAALTRAGSQGLLIRCGRAVVQLGDVVVVVFAIPGTLTEGHPSVVEFTIFDQTGSPVEAVAPDRIRHLLQLSTSLEQGLNHPIAKAIRDFAAEQDVEVIDCESWDYRVGRGVVATVKGQTVLLGNSKLLHEEGVEIWSVDSNPELDVATPIYLAVDGLLVGIHYALDRVRPDTPAMIAELHRRGIEAHMLTGDISSVAHAVAADIGLKRHEVHSDALPDQKAELVQKFTAEGKKVVFVGDGINDSAALAYADVSVSFASGSDLARETADIVLTNDRVSDVIVAQDLARHTFALVKQNIGIVGVPNLSALLIGTFLPVNPIAAVFLNNGSCLVAAGNAIRALGFKAKELPEVDASSVEVLVEPILSEASEVTPITKSSIDDKTPTPSIQLDLSALSSRVGLSYQKISARRRRSDFIDWISAHDPEGYGWEYSKDRNNYSMVAANS